MPGKVAMLTVLLLASAACDADPTAPDGFELPAPDLSTDPDRLQVGQLIAGPCNGGFVRDSAGPLLVDIHFGRPDGKGGIIARWEEVRSVHRHGGRVLYVFDVPAVRARIDSEALLQLVRSGFRVTAYDVPDPRRYDLSLIVGYRRPILDSDLARIAELGGRVRTRFDFIRALSIEIPERSVQALRVSSNVLYVELNGIACIN
jgi:hypothetical protein